MAQGEIEPGASGVVQLLAANANANLADRIAAALKRAGYRIDRGPFNPDRIDAAVALWTADALSIPALVEEARRAFAAQRLTTISIGGAEPPFGAQEIAPINLAGWRGEDDDPRWRFVLSDIETLKVRAEVRAAEPVFSAIAPLRATPPMSAPPEVQPLVANRAAADPVAALPASAKYDEGDPESVDDLFTDQAATPHHPARALWRGRLMPAAPLIAGALGALGIVAAGFIAAYWLRAGSAQEEPAPLAQETHAETVDADEPAPGANLALVRLRPGEPNPEDQEAAAQNAAEPGPGPAPDAAGEAVLQSPVEGAVEDAEAQAEIAPEILQQDDLADAPDEASGAVAHPLQPSLKPAAPDEPEVVPETSATALNETALIELAAASGQRDGDGPYRGDFFTDCAGCPDMAALDGGAFLMGARPGEEEARMEETPQRRVEIGYRFAIATRETTFDQWMACVEDSGCRAYFPYDEGWGRGERPVINVSYEDASAYARWLSAKTGRYYRLPSEAEWEFAARAGTGSAFSHGESLSADLANFDGRNPYRAGAGLFRGRTVPVTQFGHNAFGLFDMHGNVAEWTLDCWAPGHHGGPATGAARIGGDCSRRVVKGGAWNAPAADLRAAARRGADPETRSSDVGFRVVRVLD